ncbi:MAG TPA: adenylosuccinate lyase [Candidatus Limnocylindrales bacterium]|nr:adenylosuccinate lyase [Candidatus Limnocylindrales bacterium]
MHADDPVFNSPFSWRYGSLEMRRLWSEAEKHRLWRRMWVELARAQQAAGLVSADQLADLERALPHINLARIAEIESSIQHDLMAALKAFGEEAPLGAPVLHLGATSADIEDNADALRIRDSLTLIEGRLRAVVELLARRALEHADAPVMAFTHLQPAEPTTAGYRLCMYAQDLAADLESIHALRRGLRGKGLKGAVGTRASYTALLTDSAVTPAALDHAVMDAVGLAAFPITGQAYPRMQDWRVISGLAGAAASLSKLAYDLRLLQSPLSSEMAEPFGNLQVGSSAMPFKRNPIASEKIDSLGRLVASFVNVAWQNATLSFLERTLDDSANRREILPVAFLALDEMLLVAERLVRGLILDEAAARRTFERFAPFAATEPVLMAAARAGGDRQELHEHLRELSMQAWQAIRADQPNPLIQSMQASALLLKWLPAAEIGRLANPRTFLGDAPERARDFANDLLAHLDTLREEY